MKQKPFIQADLGILTHILAYSDKSRHIQPDIIRHIKLYSELCVTLTYSEPWYIQHLGKFTTRGMFRTLVYSEPWHIQNQRHNQNPFRFRTSFYVKKVNILQEINFFNTCVIFTPIVFIL